MKSWPVQDAKARFSEFLDACMAEGPQMVTRGGAEAAVLVPVDEWRRLESTARPSLKQLLLSDSARTSSLAPPRGQARRREVVTTHAVECDHPVLRPAVPDRALPASGFGMVKVSGPALPADFEVVSVLKPEPGSSIASATTTKRGRPR